MSHKTTSSLTATKLRVILAISLLLIGLLAAGLFYVGYKQLNGIATTVSQSIADANASKNTLSSLQQTERDLATNHDIVERADQVVADSNKYNYQNTVIQDLQTYAARAGLTINNIDFSGNDATTSAGVSPGASAAQGSTASTPGGNYKTNKVTITLANPVNYENFLQFLRSIELNLTKFQISSVSLTKSTENKKAVTTSSLTIELYTK